MDAPPATFEYAVVEACPAEAEAKARFPAALGRTRVVVWFDGKNYGGTVSFQDPAWTFLERTLRGPSCGVVLEALALAMAVAIDEAKPKPVVSGYVVEPLEPNPPPTPLPPPGSFLRGVDLGVGTWFGAQPLPAVAVGLAIVVGSARERSVWAPRLRVGYVASFPSSAHAGGSTAVFYSFMPRLDGCPIELGSKTLSISPCLRQDLGVLVGTAAERGHRANDFVAATGMALLGQYPLRRGAALLLPGGAGRPGVVAAPPISFAERLGDLPDRPALGPVWPRRRRFDPLSSL